MLPSWNVTEPVGMPPSEVVDANRRSGRVHDAVVRERPAVDGQRRCGQRRRGHRRARRGEHEGFGSAIVEPHTYDLPEVVDIERVGQTAGACRDQGIQVDHLPIFIQPRSSIGRRISRSPDYLPRVIDRIGDAVSAQSNQIDQLRPVIQEGVVRDGSALCPVKVGQAFQPDRRTADVGLESLTDGRCQAGKPDLRATNAARMAEPEHG